MFPTRTTVLCGISLLAALVTSEPLSYTISKTWNGHELPTAWNKIDLTISAYSIVNNSLDSILITIDAPFYNSPVLPQAEDPPQFMDGLWDYEVVEVFFLGPNEKYLEIELSPRGYYLLYFLEGVRNVTDDTLRLDIFNATIQGGTGRWSGAAVIPVDFLPEKIDKFNAYAIHNYTEGDEEFRRYMSLFPDPNGAKPDFHKLDLFQDFPIDKLFQPEPNTGAGIGIHGMNSIVFYITFLTLSTVFLM